MLGSLLAVAHADRAPPDLGTFALACVSWREAQRRAVGRNVALPAF